VAADRVRLAELTGDTSVRHHADGVPLGRVLPRLRDSRALAAVPIRLLPPSARVTWNSAIPYSMNDGALWAGRGVSATVTAGFALDRPVGDAMVRVAVAPALSHSQNLPFQILPSPFAGRSTYSNPFHGPTASLDLPHRFGDRPLTAIDFGRSALSVSVAGVTAGLTADDEWWGPGIRNALVLSNNAGGVPRVFVSTARPVRFAIGAVEAKLISGTLTQSRFFSEATLENRTLSGVVAQYRPAFDSLLTFGFARVVYAPIGPSASPLLLTASRSVDALVRWESLDSLQRSDQIGAVFARWVFPRAGLEVYGEWARMDLPQSLKEVLVAAHHSGGWTAGFQWAQRRNAARYLRLQSELTYLEQSRVFLDRPQPDFYTGIASPQGYTQRGQVIGAAIGPGASSQWLALDWFERHWQLGGFLGRIRWDNDALYRRPGSTFFHHDVSVFGGIRGGWRTPWTDFSAELTAAHRYNYLFQNGLVSPGGFRTVDVNNLTLVLAATPR
jgi:hypothetical protein